MLFLMYKFFYTNNALRLIERVEVMELVLE